MWEFTLVTHQLKPVVNNILSQTTELELAEYFHAALFSLKTTSIPKEINKGFLKTLPGITEGVG